MSANVAHSRLSEIFNEEAAAAVAAAAATAAAAENILPAQLRAPSIAPSLTYSESGDDRDEYDVDEAHLSSDDEVASIATPRRRRASTRLIAQNAADIQRITGESSTQLINRCCGGGCCLKLDSKADGVQYERVSLPDNEAYRSLNLKIGDIPTTLTSVADIPEQIAYLLPLSSLTAPPTTSEAEGAVTPTLEAAKVEAPTKALAEIPAEEQKDEEQSDSKQKTPESQEADAEVIEGLKSLVIEPEVEEMLDLDTTIQPPLFVQPHPPYHVFPARIHNARELTRPGAEKRTYHFDLDVTDYPSETGMDFKVGGAIGVSAPNDEKLVDNILDLLMIPRFLRDKKVVLRTTKGRWPTVWGDDKPRELVATRRELLTWCSDIQSYPPTKPLLRILAEYASDENEKKALLFLCSAEGQGAFCDFRTGPHVSLQQMLSAFPSSKPPLDVLLSILQPQMPRFYSLSNDPHVSVAKNGDTTRRVVEIAVTVHETSDWLTGTRTGIGSGFFERQALRYIKARERGEEIDVYVPMFKGLMANPLAKQFVPDGPMLLIGAGVGIAPFRGFVQRRLKTANCANKVWVLQGIRDSLVDELYSGEWGVHEDEVKRVVESRSGTGRYVQEEVRQQADLVWFVINSVDGRVFVCGSTRGMGEGVQEALIDVAMEKGNLGREEARKFWDLKAEVGQYIAETW
ncbi:fad binding domain-containing protein [Ophiostoma piceae UAMH 11346]|uniref:Fad binding domain-containing protein n=1 Tax=Ophiostoma piceae (strain UAMH 11346) TaxID=1262450 RepID=S3C878_OPHP1|nr:fad binding domain-containing protein [Ophiostoma piceae UAMH 11346]